MALIDVSSSQLETINLILAEHVPERHRTLAFGSRAKWTAKAQSDLDLAIDAGRKLKFSELAALEDAFESSPLPWRVDVIDLNGVSEGFRSVILRDGVALPAWKPQSGWRDQKLGDLVELKRGYDLPQGQRRAGPYPIISSSGRSGHHDRFMAKAPGVVTGRYGTIGEVFYVTEDFWPLNTALYVRDFKGAHPRYVYYLLKTLNWSLFNDKSGVPGVNRNHVHEAVVRAPALAEQKCIAGCLSAFDDKIELNRRMSETLEAMAQAIFRDWFVDFGPVRRKLAGETDPVAIMGGLTPDAARATELAALFPTSLTDERLPEGWSDSTLGQEFDVKIGKTPPRKEAEHFLGPDIGVPWCSIRDLAGGEVFISATNETLRPESVAAFRVSRLPEMTVIVSFKLTVGRVAISDCEMTTNEAIAHMMRRTDSPSAWFTFCHLRQFDYGTLGSTSSIATAVNSATIRAMPITKADRAVHEAFDLIVGPLFQRLRAAAHENRTLAETRDYLLPRLMSGEVRVTPSNTESAVA